MTEALFNTDAPQVMAWLIRDFGLSPIQAAGVLGNIGHECGGFTDMVEDNGSGRGMCQWSGPRGQKFLAFCKQQGKTIHDLEANYAFLRGELQTAYAYVVKALKSQTTLVGATMSFMNQFERPGIPASASRIQWARLALAVWDKAHGTSHPAAAPVAAQASKLPAHRARVAYHYAVLQHHGHA